MTSTNSRRDFVIALLIAVWAHVGLFFIFVLMVVLDLFSSSVVESEPKEEKPPSIQMKVVYAEPPLAPAPPEVEEALPPPTPAPEPEPLVEAVPPEPKPEPESGAEAVMPEAPAFVQTDESQAAEEAPEETPFIGERNTTATSDVGAVAGDEKMAALAGTRNRRSDPKTYDSDFLEGDASGPKGGMEDTLDTGQGDDLENEDATVMQDAQPESVEESLPEIEEELPKPLDTELPSIDDTLAALDEVIGEREKLAPPPPPKPVEKPVEKVEEAIPERPATKKKEAAKRNGGFATKATKTRIAGVLSASGKGSLNVADTPAGRYEASILKKLETIWQMDNITNRSLNAPGQITLFFVVDQKGQVTRQRQISRVGTSDNQWGRVLGAVGRVAIPEMPKAVIKDLDGDTLKLTVTFNY